MMSPLAHGTLRGYIYFLASGLHLRDLPPNFIPTLLLIIPL
jgi:hypothetical protein